MNHIRRIQIVAVSAAIMMALLATPCAMAQPVLSLEGSCPGPMRAELRGAPPNQSAFLLFSPSTGHFRIPFGPCYGRILGLGHRGIREVASVIIDPTGIAIFEGAVGPAACGGYLQVLTNFCETSNVIQIE